MNALASLGVILLFALMAGHLVKCVRIPEVTGYILAGVAVGPSFLGWISHENLASLQVFSEVALGLILFSIGSIFRADRFQPIGRKAVKVTVIESLVTGTLVTVGSLAAGQPWTISILLGAISIETAAATTMMVMRECNSHGELTETLTGVIALNNICCLICFSLAASAIALWGNSGAAAPGIYESLYPLAWQLAGSAALGYLIGAGLSAWASHVKEQGETLILMGGAVLLCVGVAEWLDLSPLVASLAVGATMVNLSARSRSLFDALSRTDPPLYAIFFVIAGADLNLALLPTIGLVGVLYVIGRSAGKFLGTRYAARRAGLSPSVQRHMGLAMLSQAGLAIGLVMATNDRFPEIGPIVTTVVLASIAVFELAGPMGARVALIKSGEARPQDTEPAVLLD